MSSFSAGRTTLPYGGSGKSGMILAIMITLGSTAALAQMQPEGHLRSWLGVDLFQMLGASDFIGKSCMTLLTVFSILSWMVIIYKTLHLRQAWRQTNHFVDECNRGSGRLQDAYQIAGEYPDSPLAQILREAYVELEVENWYRDGYKLDLKGRIEFAKIGIERIFERTIANELTHLESKVIFLATASNVCPFIGLFGTVWGIMAAFQSLTVTGNASLNALAPGLSTALVTTVGGLFVAIPCSVMYNYFTHRIRVLTNRMDAFALELGNVIQKQLIQENS